MEKTAAHNYLEVAASHGVQFIFGLPGTSGGDFIGSIIEQEKIRFILALHETCVVSMADGYARATGRPTLAQVSTLPGTANSVGALYDAYRDRSPIVVTSTQVDGRIMGRDSHTEARDLTGIVKQFTKWSWEVNRSDRIPEALNRAFKVATTPPKGPVYLALPSNLLGEEAKGNIPQAERFQIIPRMAGDREALKQASRLLIEAKRPLIVAGSGIATSGAEAELIRLADLVAAPVVMEPRYSFLSFPTTHPFSFQIPERQVTFKLPVWGDPDLIFAIGCRLIREYRYLNEIVIKPETRCVHIEEDPWEIGKVFPVDIGIVADARSALTSIIKNCSRLLNKSNDKCKAERLDYLKKAKKESQAVVETRAQEGWNSVPIHPPRLVREMDRLFGNNLLIVNESPTTKEVLMSNFAFSTGRSYFSNSAGGYLGWGLGAAIGAQISNLKQKVVACLGDGSMMFGLQGLWTLAKYHIPLLVIVFNNQAYMAVKNQFRGSDKQVKLAGQLSADLVGPNLNFARLAQCFGIFGLRVEKPDEIAGALEKALKQTGPAVVDVVISQKSRKD